MAELGVGCLVGSDASEHDAEDDQQRGKVVGDGLGNP